MNPTLTNREIVKERKKNIASRKNLARSALMQEMREEMLDLPEEVFDQEDKGMRLLEEEKEIEDFEADNFKRVSLTKSHKMKLNQKRKEMREQARAAQGIDGLSLGDITAVLQDDKDEEQEELEYHKKLS